MRLRSGRWPVRIILGLRDVIDEPDAVRDSWLRDGIFDLLDGFYDHILVYGSREVFDPVREYGFSPRAAAKTSFCGYIRKPDPLLPAEEIRSDYGAETHPFVVVTVGGGGDGARIVETYFDMLEAARQPDWSSCIVAGPLLTGATHALLKHRAANLANVSLIPFSKHLMSLVNAADAVVAMGGYNTVSEVVGLGKRAVVVPRTFPRQEQLIRAKRLAELGLLSFIHPDTLDANCLRTALDRSLSGPPPTGQLDFAGLSRAGDVLLGALDRMRLAPPARETLAHV